MSEDFHNAIPKVTLALKNVYSSPLRGCDELVEHTKLRRNVFSKPFRPYLSLVGLDTVVILLSIYMLIQIVSVMRRGSPHPLPPANPTCW